MFFKKRVLKISQISERTALLESVFKAFSCNINKKKKTPTQVFSCEICEIFKNTLIYRTLPVAASDLNTKGFFEHFVLIVREKVKGKIYLSLSLFVPNAPFWISLPLLATKNNVSIYNIMSAYLT